MSKTYWLRFGSASPASTTGLFPTLTVFSSEGLTALAAPGITETPASSGLYRFIYGTTTSVVFVADGGATLASTDRYVVGVLDPIQSVNEVVNGIGSTLGSMGSTQLALGTTQVAMGATVSTILSEVLALGSSQLIIDSKIDSLGVSMVNMGITLVSIGDTLAAIDISSVSATLSHVATQIGFVTDGPGDNVTVPSTVLGLLSRAGHAFEGDQTYDKLTGSYSMYDRTGATLLASKAMGDTATQTSRS
jgi:hypothetical protein